MSNVSLQSAIRTCKVDVSWANKIESDRFLNPQVMTCPPWNGHDTAGRPVCADSYYTKTAGCNSAKDRITVENNLRPQYIEYVTLDAQGLVGDCPAPRKEMFMKNLQCQKNALKQSHKKTGQFGYETGFSQNIIGNCLACENYDRTAGAPAPVQDGVIESYINSRRHRRRR